MKYNTMKNAVITLAGNVILTGDQITELISVSETTVETMTANSGTGTYDKLIIDIDLGVRLHTSEVKYYFDSDVSSTAVASGISFQYKNESFQDYTSLPIYIDQEYYYTNTSGTLFAPRYIKVTHELSETDGFLTTLSGYITGGLYGLEVLNDDTYVDFGAEGTATGDTVSVIREGTADIRTIQIYNSGLLKATAYVSLDPTYTDLDSVMAISLSEDGPWVFPLDEDLVIMRAGEDDDYGIYNNNTELKDGVIKLVEYSDADDDTAISVESGNYTTKVFLNDNTTWNSIIVDRVLPLNGSLQVDSNDGVETIEVRSSNYTPKPYHIYRELHDSITGDYSAYTDKWVETDQTKGAPVNLFKTDYGLPGWKNYFIIIDKKTERFGGFAFASYPPASVSEWWLFNTDSNTVTKSKKMAASTASLSFDWKNVKFDYEGGMWVYFYAVSYSSSNFVNTTGYYLCYFDSSLTEKFKYFNTVDFVGAMGVSYTTKYLWCTMPESNQIQQLSSVGAVLYNHFENTEDLGGLCVLYDGTVWYANGKNLYNLKETGIADDTKTLVDVADNKFIVIASDGDGAEFLWVLENFYVSRIILSGENKGTKEFSVYVDSALRLYPVDSGVWVWCADIDNPGDSYMRYISKANKRIDKEYKTEYNSTPGVLEHTYEDPLYTSKMPLVIDQEWSNLEWKKVNTESFILPEDNYHQTKITLKRQTPYQKYGSGVGFDTVFHTDDDFNQIDSSPNTIIWGNYRADERVYIEDNQLVLTNDSGGDLNSYINTKDRYVLTGNFDVQFDYIMGDGTQTDKNEYIYLYAYAIDTGVWGQYIMSRIFIPSLLTSTSYIHYYINGSSSYTSLGTNYNRWTGKLRLKRSGDSVYGYVWDPQTSSWKGASRTGVNALGNYFYLQIQADRNGSNIYVDNFTVTAGTAYYYSESPKIKGIYVKKEVELKDIYPNTSKNVYLKSYVSDAFDVEGNYDTTLRARWRTLIN